MTSLYRVGIIYFQTLDVMHKDGLANTKQTFVTDHFNN